jgi:hypothetical protein
MACRPEPTCNCLWDASICALGMPHPSALTTAARRRPERRQEAAAELQQNVCSACVVGAGGRFRSEWSLAKSGKLKNRRLGPSQAAPPSPSPT